MLARPSCLLAPCVLPVTFAAVADAVVQARIYAGTCAAMVILRVLGGIVDIVGNNWDIGLTPVASMLIGLLMIHCSEIVMMVAMLLWMRYRAPRARADDLAAGLLEAASAVPYTPVVVERYSERHSRSLSTASGDRKL